MENSETKTGSHTLLRSNRFRVLGAAWGTLSLLGAALIFTSLSPSSARASGKTIGHEQGASLSGKSSPVVTFSGLRVYKDGSSTLQVSLTGSAPVAFTKTGKTLKFVLKGAKVELKNNRNPLRAEYFRSNVVKTKLNDSKEGATLKIELRKAVQPEHRMIKHAGGAILRIDIPPAR